MSSRMKNMLWFAIPALAAAGALAAISIPGVEEARQEIGADTLTEPIIALVLFAAIGGAVVGGAFYGIRRLVTGRRSPKPRGGRRASSG